MKILAVTPWFPSVAAPGAGVFNLRDVELLSRDHEVTVVHLFEPGLIPRPEPHQVGETVTVIPVPFNTGVPSLVVSAARCIRVLAAEHDLLHSMAFSALLPVALSRVGRRPATRLPWVHTEHWSGLVTKAPTLRSKIGGIVLQPLLRAPDEVVTVGSHLAAVVNSYRAHRTDPTIIPNFVRLVDASHRPQPPELRGPDPLRLVAVGGVIERKGVLEAVRTVGELETRGITAELQWIGEGQFLGHARREADRLGISNRVHFVGFVAPEHLAESLLAHHIFVLPTDGETFGVAIAEAIAVGLPVVTSGVGGHLEFLPPEASRVVRKDPRAIAAAISDLVSDEHRWPPERIIEYARSAFSEDSRRDKYRAVYERAKQRTRR